MTQTPEEPGTAVRDLIDRLFEDAEPPHRPGMADASIAYGAAVAGRRRGFTAVGATLGVLATAAGAAAFIGGAWPGDWSRNAGSHGAPPNPYEDATPTYSDKFREIQTDLPGLLTPLLPAGMTLAHDPSLIGTTSPTTGDMSPDFTLHTPAGDAILRVDADDTGYEDSFSRAPATVPVPVDGGSIRVRTVPEDGGSATYFEFKPTDPAKPAIRFLVHGIPSAPLDTEAFVHMVDASGFRDVATLLDPADAATPAAVQARYRIEARIAAATAGVLPAGFRLKLAPGFPAAVELVGPHGVDEFEWSASTGPGDCPDGTLCYQDTGSFGPAGPDGGPRLGTYSFAADGMTIRLMVVGQGPPTPTTGPRMLEKLRSETAPQGPGLTPEQALTILRTPNLVQVIDEVTKATNP